MTATEHATSDRALSVAQKQAGKFLARCQSEAVQVTIFGDAEVSALTAWRARTPDLKPTLTHLLMAALVRALLRHPDLNAHYEDGRLKRFDDVHLGVAVATPKGDLLTPVVRNLRGKSLTEIAALTSAKTEKARSGALTLQDVKGAGFTLSNVGQSRTARYATPVVPLPQVAILATVAVREEPVIRDGTAVATQVLPMSLTFDHRVLNGVAASAFLETFAEILRCPEALTGAADSPLEEPR